MSKHDHHHAGDAPGRATDSAGTARLPPVRWIEAAAASTSRGDGEVEQRIGVLLAKLPEPAAFTAGSYTRVAARLRPSAARQGTPPRAWDRRRLVLGAALGVGVLLLSGAVIAGGGARAWWHRLGLDRAESSVFRSGAPVQPRPRTRASRADLATREIAPPAPPASPARPVTDEAAPAIADEPTARRDEATPPVTARPRRRSTASRHERIERPLAVATPAPAPAEVPAAVPVPPRERPAPTAPPAVEPVMPPLPSPSSSWMAAPDPAPRPARGAPTSVSPPTPPSQLSQEARLLNVAMVQLRQRRDGVGALATLNDYLARYPHGMLASEARGARIDALLLLQRKNEALRALDAARLEPVGRGLELLVIRGELRARRDCGDAVRDFNLVLGGAAPSALEERALFGRTVCRRRQGDEQGARTDADAYLTRFPAGRFMAPVRRLLDGDRDRTR